MACCRYVEINPVAARLCANHADYPWSSCLSKIGGKELSWLDFDPLYLDLSVDVSQRPLRYREFIDTEASGQEREMIRLAVQRGQLTDGGRFVDEIEKKLNRRIELRGQGRPRKVEK